MEEVTDPEELAKIQARRDHYERNAAWLQAHTTEVYPRHRGKCICIAGEGLFKDTCAGSASTTHCSTRRESAPAICDIGLGV